MVVVDPSGQRQRLAALAALREQQFHLGMAAVFPRMLRFAVLKAGRAVVGDCLIWPRRERGRARGPGLFFHEWRSPGKRGARRAPLYSSFLNIFPYNYPKTKIQKNACVFFRT